MAAKKTKRRTTKKPASAPPPEHHGHRIRKPIVDIINELKSWLPNYDRGEKEYPTILLRLLAALPGGEELEDVGYEPLGNISWHEADQLARVIDAIKDKQDVEDIARELLSDNPEEIDERGSPPPSEADEPTLTSDRHRSLSGSRPRSARTPFGHSRRRTGAPRRRR